MHHVPCDIHIRFTGTQNVTFIFFFNDTATTEIYTLSLHDALPISWELLLTNSATNNFATKSRHSCRPGTAVPRPDRKSTRLNSSHSQISYAVFCLKKKKKRNMRYTAQSQNESR